jgi:hypothetical protein
MSPFSSLYTESDTVTYLKAMFSAEKIMVSLAGQIERWKKATPEGRELVITMTTPEGRLMDVTFLKPVGWQAYLAEGNLDGSPCMVVGHIATLALFCSYVEVKDEKAVRSVGFRIETERSNEPQPATEPIATDKK